MQQPQPGQARTQRATVVVDRLTGQDLAVLWPDDFGWPQDIGIVAVLDGTGLFDPDGHLRIGEVREAIAGPGLPCGTFSRRSGLPAPA
jgi:hypothetical protein